MRYVQDYNPDQEDPLRLNILGMSLSISDPTSANTEVVNSLIRDFAESDLKYLAGKSLNIEFLASKPRRKGFSTFWKPGWNIMRAGQSRIYEKGHTYADVIFGRSDHIVKIYGKDPTDLYWFLYLFILSVTGEWMELTGWMRFHALSWSADGQANAIVAASGDGKSTAAVEMYFNRWKNLKVLSDEIFWTDGVSGFAYPTRLSVRDRMSFESIDVWQELQLSGQFHKWMLNEKIPVQVLPLGHIYLTNKKLKSFIETFLGLGLPQMAEHLLRPGFIERLASLSTNRIIILSRLLRASKLNWDFLHESAKNTDLQSKYISDVVDRIQSR